MIFSHPQNVCMTYWKHLKLSMGLSFLFMKGATCALIHSFIPDILLSSSTDISNQITQILKDNGCRKNKTE